MQKVEGNFFIAMTREHLYIVEDIDSNAVIIGKSEDPMKRLANLRKMNPHNLRMLHIFPLMGWVEPHLNHIYSPMDQFRIRGEWYKNSPEFMDVVFDYVEGHLYDFLETPFSEMGIEFGMVAHNALREVWEYAFKASQPGIMEE